MKKNVIYKLSEAQASRRPMNKWINLKDKEPRDHEDILVFDGKTVSCARMWKSHGKNLWSPGSTVMGHDKEFTFMDEEVTHWMKLPEPPEL